MMPGVALGCISAQVASFCQSCCSLASSMGQAACLEYEAVPFISDHTWAFKHKVDGDHTSSFWRMKRLSLEILNSKVLFRVRSSCWNNVSRREQRTVSLLSSKTLWDIFRCLPCEARCAGWSGHILSSVCHELQCTCVHSDAVDPAFLTVEKHDVYTAVAMLQNLQDLRQDLAYHLQILTSAICTLASSGGTAWWEGEAWLLGAFLEYSVTAWENPHSF